jgi:hypothetical protein
MTQDDRYDLNKLISNGQMILPKSGLVCPRCGFEASRAPDGRPSDSIWFNKVVNGQVQQVSPLYHKACVEDVQLDREIAYMNEHVGPWIPKEEYHVPGSYREEKGS